MYLVTRLKFKRRSRREHREFKDLISFSANTALSSVKNFKIKQKKVGLILHGGRYVCSYRGWCDFFINGVPIFIQAGKHH